MRMKSLLQMIIAMLIFGTIGIFVRSMNLPSGFVAMVRGLSGMLFMILVICLKKSRINWKSIQRNLKVLILSGTFIGANWILLFEAYRYTSVATATLCYYLQPVFVILASHFVLKEKLTIKKLICALIALSGMVFISGILQLGETGNPAGRGILCGVGAALLYACVIFFNKLLKDISAYDMTMMQLGIAAVVLLPYTLLTEKVNLLQIAPKDMILLLIVGIIHTGISYLLYFSAMQGLKAQTIAILSYIDPVTAIILSAVLLSEPMDAYSLIGAILILGATLVSEVKIQRKRRKC